MPLLSLDWFLVRGTAGDDGLEGGAEQAGRKGGGFDHSGGAGTPRSWRDFLGFLEY